MSEMLGIGVIVILGRVGQASLAVGFWRARGWPVWWVSDAVGVAGHIHLGGGV